MSEPIEPKMIPNVGMPVAPMFYPRLLRRLADIIDGLDSLNAPDEKQFESPHFAFFKPIEIYNEEVFDPKENPRKALQGWIIIVESGTHAFVPYIAEIEETV